MTTRRRVRNPRQTSTQARAEFMREERKRLEAVRQGILKSPPSAERDELLLVITSSLQDHPHYRGGPGTREMLGIKGSVVGIPTYSTEDDEYEEPPDTSHIPPADRADYLEGLDVTQRFDRAMRAHFKNLQQIESARLTGKQRAALLLVARKTMRGEIQRHLGMNRDGLTRLLVRAVARLKKRRQ